MSREIFASDVHQKLPPGWREAANWHIRTCTPVQAAELQRILRDRRMLPFWRKVSATKPTEPEQARVLAILIAGGDPPAENPGEITRRRRKLAAHVRKLSDLISADPDARHIDVEALLHWTCPKSDAPRHSERQRLFYSHGAMVERAVLVTDEARAKTGLVPSIASALSVLADNLDANTPLWCFDPTQRAPWVLNRGLSVGARLVRSLMANLRHLIDEGDAAIAATVLTGESIGLSKSRAMWAEYLSQNPTR